MEYLYVSRCPIHRLRTAEQLAGHQVDSQWRYWQRDVAACVQATIKRSTRWLMLIQEEGEHHA